MSRMKNNKYPIIITQVINHNRDLILSLNVHYIKLLINFYLYVNLLEKYILISHNKNLFGFIISLLLFKICAYNKNF